MGSAFNYEIVKSHDQQTAGDISVVHCHGRFTNECAGDFKQALATLVTQSGKVVIDLSDVTYLDSSGLGALVGLKTSSLNAGRCHLTVVNFTPRIKELLNLAKLTDLFAT